MATSQLKLYNRALLHLGERSLSTLSDNNENRRSLDTVWDSGAIRGEWLSQGLWNFAIRTTSINYESGMDPSFGFARAFTKPSDWVRTAMVATDEYFRSPLTQYEDEQGYLFADVDVLYFGYVSDDSAYGLDYSLWPELFTRYCELDLAVKIMNRSTGLSESQKDKLLALHRRALIDARSKDAMNEPARFPPSGSWVQSRQAGPPRRVGSSWAGS